MIDALQIASLWLILKDDGKNAHLLRWKVLKLLVAPATYRLTIARFSHHCYVLAWSRMGILSKGRCYIEDFIRTFIKENIDSKEFFLLYQYPLS